MRHHDKDLRNMNHREIKKKLKMGVEKEEPRSPKKTPIDELSSRDEEKESNFVRNLCM